MRTSIAHTAASLAAVGSGSLAKTLWLMLWVVLLGPVAASVGWLLLTVGRLAVRRVMVRAALRRLGADVDTSDELAALVDDLSRRCAVTVERVVVAGTTSRRRPAGRRVDPRHTAHWLQTGRRRGVLLLGPGLAADRSLARAAVAHELGHGAANDTSLKRKLEVAVDVLEILAISFFLTGGFWQLWGVVAVLGVGGKALTALVSRRLEYAADAFAVALVGGQEVADLFEVFEELEYGVDMPGLADNLLSTHPFSAKRRARALAVARRHGSAAETAANTKTPHEAGSSVS